MKNWYSAETTTIAHYVDLPRDELLRWLKWLHSMLADPDCPDGVNCQGCGYDQREARRSLAARIASLETYTTTAHT